MRGFRFASLRWFVTCGLLLSVVFIGLFCFKNAGFFVSSNGLNLGGSEIQGSTTPSPTNSFLTVGQPNKDGSKKLETVQGIPKNFCEKYPKTLLGELSIDILEIFSNSLTDDETRNMEIGGSWKPSDCTPQEKVAFIIPFRERPKQLQVFLNHMHRVLQRQKLYYRIFITEQVGTEKFNKGAIYNIGFQKTFEFDNYDCYIFHDIDLLTENDYNIYTCAQSPMQMSVVVNSPTYNSGKAIFGGIQAMKKEHYVEINGHSNLFWGWGGEDDNLAQRLKLKQLVINRPQKDVARYTKNMKNHHRIGGLSIENLSRVRQGIKTVDDDGLTTVKSLKYTLTLKLFPLYTLFSIDLQR